MKKTLSQANKDLDLRRFGKDVYSKALGEGGSGEITADDITPELLENGDVLRRIQNWGLSDEEIENIPEISFPNSVYNSFEREEEMSFSAQVDGCTIDDIYTPTAFDELPDLSQDKFKYIIYGKKNSAPQILKRTYYSEMEHIEYQSISSDFRIGFFNDSTNFIGITVGITTL